MTIAFEPYSHEHKQDPYPQYRELRDHAPVHYAPSSESWCFSRYDDVQWVLRSPEIFSSSLDRRRGPMRRRLGATESVRVMVRFLREMKVSPRRAMRARMLINEDGEVHAVMRRLVNRGFTPRRIASWEPRMREIVAGCMEALERKESFDLVQDLAIPLPVTVIAELLGVDPERRLDFKRWSDAIIEGGTGSGLENLGGSALLGAMGELRRYLRPLVRSRRAEPRDDLLSVLVSAQEGEVGLDDYEIFMFVLLLLIAGNETTTNLLGNAVDALLDHPSELARVAAEPARVPDLVEEVLRYDGPVQFLTRTVLADVERHGVTIPKGATAVVLLGSANRDERRFPEPDRLDVGRDTRGHLGFGFGAHFCLGASLARLEARVALDALVPRLPRLARAAARREFLDSYLIRGRSRLELRAAA